LVLAVDDDAHVIIEHAVEADARDPELVTCAFEVCAPVRARGEESVS
jgi:hypothetical protein